MSITMQLELTKQLNAALDEQYEIMLRLQTLTSRGERKSKEYLQLEQRTQFIENFTTQHKHLKDNLKDL